jgi:hypothetical protein
MILAATKPYGLQLRELSEKSFDPYGIELTSLKIRYPGGILYK